MVQCGAARSFTHRANQPRRDRSFDRSSRPTLGGRVHKRQSWNTHADGEFAAIPLITSLYTLFSFSPTRTIMSDVDTGGNGGSAESPDTSKAGINAPKDRSCPYCGQAFTSSSLGRHLDLYIKEKNPKPADGLHDVDAIKKMRSGITRRQPRGSLAARRDASTPGTPTGSVSTTRKSPEARQHTSVPKDGQFMVDQSPVYPWQQPRWEATGVINDIPAKTGEPSTAMDESADQARRASTQPQRAPSRAAQKQQFDARQKLADAMDTARAAELALRELLSSWRAAKSVNLRTLLFTH